MLNDHCMNPGIKSRNMFKIHSEVPKSIYNLNVDNSLLKYYNPLVNLLRFFFRVNYVLIKYAELTRVY